MSAAMGDLLGTPPAEVDVKHGVVAAAIEKLETPKCPESRPTNEDLPPPIDHSDSDDEDSKSFSDDEDRPAKNDDAETEDDDDKSVSDDGKDDEDDGDGVVPTKPD